jgi:hypothetical protein
MLGADILIGAPDDFGGGSVFLYRVSDTGAVSFRAKLRCPVPRIFDGFGASVALGTGVALAAAPEADGASSFGGAVHLFSLLDTSWTGALRSTAPSIGGLFGYSISAQGGAVLVGAPDEANQQGRTHVYDLGQTFESAPIESWVAAGTFYSPVLAPPAITQDGQEYAFVGWVLNREILVSTNGEPVNPPPSVALSDPIELVAHYRGTRREPVPGELRLSISRAPRSGIITFQVEGVPGENYMVESVPSLFGGRWSESMQFFSTNRVHILELPGPQTTATNNFFRVRRN